MKTLQSVGNREAGALSRDIVELGPWFQNLHLPGGIQTAPDHPLGDYPGFLWAKLANVLPDDLTGWTALEIGCNAGFYTFQLAARGAEVVGIDFAEHYLRQARWAAAQLDLTGRVEFRQMQVYDLAHTSQDFDLVLFMGVFYHLRYPLLALDAVAQIVRKLLVFQSLSMLGTEEFVAAEDMGIHERERFEERGWPKMAFIEHEFAGDPTNWWIPNHACNQAMLRSVGMDVLACPAPEIYVCRPRRENSTSAFAYETEFRAATGTRTLR